VHIPIPQNWGKLNHRSTNPNFTKCESESILEISRFLEMEGEYVTKIPRFLEMGQLEACCSKFQE